MDVCWGGGWGEGGENIRIYFFITQLAALWEMGAGGHVAVKYVQGDFQHELGVLMFWVLNRGSTGLKKNLQKPPWCLSPTSPFFMGNHRCGPAEPAGCTHVTLARRLSPIHRATPWPGHAGVFHNFLRNVTYYTKAELNKSTPEREQIVSYRLEAQSNPSRALNI